jgi:hypothetical protein
VLAKGDGSGGVRLVELVAALWLATDLGLGLPQEHVLRQTTIAARLAALASLSDAQQVAVYYTSLLAWVGCVSDSHELAKWFGDEAHLRAASYQVDKKGLPMMTFMIGHVGDGSPPVRRLTTIARFLSGGSREAGASLLTHCQTAGLLAARAEVVPEDDPEARLAGFGRAIHASTVRRFGTDLLTVRFDFAPA